MDYLKELAEKNNDNYTAARVLSEITTHKKEGTTDSADLASIYAEKLTGEASMEVIKSVLSMKVKNDAQVIVNSEDIAGHDDLKKMVLKLLNSIKRPDIYRGIRAPPKGLLLYGPPGTGKTTIAKWVAHIANATFFDVRPSQLISKFYGDTESTVAAIFKIAAFEAPSIIFIDEIDSVLSKRKDNNDEASLRMKNMLLQAIDGFNSNGDEVQPFTDVKKKHVLVIAATNRPDKLDDAALRRFEKRAYVGLPDFEARVKQLQIIQAKNRQDMTLTDDDINRIVQSTDSWNCSDINQLAATAAGYPLDDLYDKYGYDVDNISEV